jgi:hypothetical protein
MPPKPSKEPDFRAKNVKVKCDSKGVVYISKKEEENPMK